MYIAVTWALEDSDIKLSPQNMKKKENKFFKLSFGFQTERKNI